MADKFCSLFSKRTKDGMLDYKEVVKIIAPEISYSDLVKNLPNGEKPPMSANQYYKIHSGRSERKKRQCNYGLSTDEKNLIAEFCMSSRISRVSPNNVYVEKRISKYNQVPIILPMFYRNYSITEIYNMFKEKHPEIKCGRTTFRNNIPNNVKKATSRFDVCPICKEIRQNKDFLNRQYLEGEELAIQNAMLFHKQLVNDRSLDFVNQLQNIKEGQCILVMDFKANISLGKGPEEGSNIFFNAPQRSVFGVVCYFRRNNQIFKVIFTVVSEILQHDSKTVVEILNNNVLNHPIFNEFNIKKLNFWMDNAPNHFRTKEMIAGFYNIKKKFGYRIEFNYSAEYHGKSECDRHFGLISRIYKEHCCRYHSNDINTTQEFIDMYKNFHSKTWWYFNSSY